MSGGSAQGRRRLAIRLAAGAAVALSSVRASATTRVWNTTSAGWTLLTNWTPNGTPTSNDIIEIENSDTTSRIITYDYTGAAVTLTSLFIDNTGTGTDTLSMAANNLTVGSLEQIGISGNGAVTQSGGVNTLTGGSSVGLSLGVNAGGVGNYTLSGTGTLTNSNATGTEYIGFNGTGTFTQTGGTNNLSGANSAILLGWNTGAHGAYNLSGGTVSAAAISAGVAFQSGAGILSVSGGSLTAGTLTVFPNTGSAISFIGGSITAGTLNTQGVPANFSWTGGTLTLTQQILNFDSANLANSPLGSSRTLASGQTLNVNGGAAENIGGVGSGSLTVNSGATNSVSGAISVNPLGTLTINGGSVSTTSVVNNQGSVVTTGGSLSNSGFNNQGSMTVNNVGGPGVALSNGVNNSGSIIVANGAFLAVNGLPLDSTGTLQISGGTIAGSAAVINDYGGNMYATGTISSTSFTNNGTVNLTGALNANSTTNTNNGLINVSAPAALGGSGGNLTNNGLIMITNGSVNLPVANHGVVQGGGTVFLAVAGNDGVIAATNIVTPLLVTIAGSNAVDNNADGEMRVVEQAIMNVNGLQFVNNGLINMQGPNAVLNGVAMGNFGTIQGQGRISNAVTNQGVVAPAGGQLMFAGGLTNAAAGQVQLQSGATALVTGASSNSGTVALNGGTYDNGVSTFTNNSGAFLIGNGTFKSGGLTNNGTVSFADSPTSVFGPVTNNASLKITSNTTTFFGAVTNAATGTIKVSTGTSRFLTTFTNNGTFNSDPAVNQFASMDIGPSGVLLGGSGDQFIISGDLINTSERNTAWNTAASLVSFTGGLAHNLAWSGTNLGTSYQGYVDNFAIGTLELAAGNTLTLEPGGAIYVASLSLDGRPSDPTQLAAYVAQAISNSDGSKPTDIYYDPGQASNAYLSDSTYALGNGGVLAPVPEPAVLGVIVLLAPAILRRRRVQS